MKAMELEALSREIAETSSDWLVSGVETFSLEGNPLRVCCVNRPGEPGVAHGMNRHGCAVRWPIFPGMRPNLEDQVTVNSLLLSRLTLQPGRDSLRGAYWWCGPTDIMGNGEVADTRTEAICKAWIEDKKVNP